MGQNNPDLEASHSNVYIFTGKPRQNREPPLSDQEIVKVRQLLSDAAKVFGNCPLAKRALNTQ